MRSARRNRIRPTVRPAVGLFGKFGAGNIGNDASMEAVLNYVRNEHPDAIVDAMCTGPDRVRSEYGMEAIHLFWHHKYPERASGAVGTVLKVVGKVADAVRIASWSRRHDIVIVPGAGMLEASLPMLPRGFPYALFLVSASGKLFGTRVALVSVGAGAVNQRVTRWLFNSAARFAFYRSYRDDGARRAMDQRGLDTSRDNVYPDLAFALPGLPYDPGDANTVGVGLMAYRGTNDERREAEDIYSSYLSAMKAFVRWLVDNGRQVRLLVGDTNGSDDEVVQEVLDDVRAHRPNLPSSCVAAVSVSSFHDVMRVMQPLGSVVGIRYHNLVCALKLSKPTISISYSPKHDVLMADMNLPEFCQNVNSLSVDQLSELFLELEKRSPQLGPILVQRNSANTERSNAQFAELSTVLFSAADTPTVRDTPLAVEGTR